MQSAGANQGDCGFRCLPPFERRARSGKRLHDGDTDECCQRPTNALFRSDADCSWECEAGFTRNSDVKVYKAEEGNFNCFRCLSCPSKYYTLSACNSTHQTICVQCTTCGDGHDPVPNSCTGARDTTCLPKGTAISTPLAASATAATTMPSTGAVDSKILDPTTQVADSSAADSIEFSNRRIMFISLSVTLTVLLLLVIGKVIVRRRRVASMRPITADSSACDRGNPPQIGPSYSQPHQPERYELPHVRTAQVVVLPNEHRPASRDLHHRSIDLDSDVPVVHQGRTSNRVGSSTDRYTTAELRL